MQGEIEAIRETLQRVIDLVSKLVSAGRRCHVLLLLQQRLTLLLMANRNRRKISQAIQKLVIGGVERLARMMRYRPMVPRVSPVLQGISMPSVMGSAVTPRNS